MYSFPIIGLDGTIFVSDFTGKAYAFDIYGRMKWDYELGAEIRATPAISKIGQIIIPTRQGIVYSLVVIPACWNGLFLQVVW